VKPSNALHLYRVRLRARIWQESFAVLGIAAGVALLFASQVSSASLQSSVSQLSRGVVGNATLQLLARGPHGFPQSTLGSVRRIPGVRLAAPVLETDANAIGPHGSRQVELIGADESLSQLGGALAHDTELSPFGGIGAIVLPAPLARAIGVVKFGQEATLQLNGRSARAPLYAQLGQRRLGSLIDSPVALMPLSFLQEIGGLPARISRILIEPRAGAQERVRAALRTLAGGRLNVEGTGYDEQLFAAAATASSRSTTLFAAISALVGFLFAFNAMLITVPQRRRLIADLRRDGYTPRTVIAVLVLDAVVLGLGACVLGLILGDQLSIHLLHPNRAFLSLAFALGSQRVITWQSVGMAVGGGMLAAILAVLGPVRDALSRDPLAAINPREGFLRSAGAEGRLALAGVACLAAATATLLLAPMAAVAGMVMLVAALLLELPLALSASLALLQRLATAITSAVPHVAVMELRAAHGRAIAIAATGAIAVFGSVTIQGAHGDLLKGLDGAARETNALSDLWVSPAGSYNLLMTTPFAPSQQAKLERLPGIRAVRVYRSGFLDYGARRVLVIAPPAQAAPLLPDGQLISGDAGLAGERVRAGGWLVLSKAIADEHHLRIGQAFTLASPVPTRFRLAALSTNLGWAPGSIVMNAADYARAWGSTDASAFSVLLDPGVTAAQGALELRRALGPSFAVQSAQQHAAQQDALSRQALERLGQIAALILTVAVLAMSAAIAAMIWQRRARLAKLKLEGIPRAALWRTLLLENVLLLGVGCLTGAAFGVYGQQLADRALASAINFPVVESLGALTALVSLTLVAGAALAILAIPGYLAASVPASLALQD
jgi:putative ABC transport system permease protein